ncbi:efflux RND transporter periplasmic adaptor subunit [Chromobacterium alticapitis]|uniref:Efflux transporter periplasmic adaptor subunit n=1 Tax=Chromobacterium alticapitis TaxID=2073169 RepID=A0A2S5DAY1_9NEIS|nr:efflux RND transporter periplasmic adaptor subunit [Chromobacterium alticapitis]POZ60151.1 efflux transporter periplasmic adaptor subunit [Chromobacterium alticapitis]
MRANTVIRYLITLALLAAAVWIGKALWDRYMLSPWTRDGRVKADVVSVAADVSGLVTEVAVKDNQAVRKGDVLFAIDPARYRAALAQAEAALAGHKADKTRRGKEAARRASLDSAIVSTESRESADFAASAADAQYQAALAARDLAALNLSRAVVRAPADGYVTNLNVHVGDYAAAGAARLALIDSHSFYVDGYFEETKLANLKVGERAEVTLMSDGRKLGGRIASIARGITDRDAATGRELLADVNPTFNWVRLAQRVPVRIELDALPKDLALIAGQTCTVVIAGH